MFCWVPNVRASGFCFMKVGFGRSDKMLEELEDSFMGKCIKCIPTDRIHNCQGGVGSGSAGIKVLLCLMVWGHQCVP